jgi:hypothetical protein
VLVTGSHIEQADLTAASLSGVLVTGSHIEQADLTAANLSGAAIGGCHFEQANLSGANLSGALLSGDLRGATLTRARMDPTTVFGNYGEAAQLDAQTRVLDVSWNGAILALVDWDHLPRLGDEERVKGASNRTERVTAYRDVARAYRGLAKALQAQGLSSPSLRYRAREQYLERKALLNDFKLGQWLLSSSLNVVSGYGDRPGRALGVYLAVVGAFTGAYWALTNQVFGFITSNSAHLAWYEALVLSISSFHGRGFFPSIPNLGDPIALVAAAEAIIGLFIELVFIATFTQRFFAR